ncbi:MAG TPA: PilZ domain-containing protein [Sedimentibacter sp.]|nr:PilZ domain-containing protein [Sedimentibacter sp.]
MIDTDKIVKIYDEDSKLIGKGQLLSLNEKIIKVKGTGLPILSRKTNVIIEIYSEFVGISRYCCRIDLASDNQLNAHIVKKKPDIERRNSLKVRTDLSYYVESLYRNDKDITKDFPNMKINLINLSIGGMLISSNYELYINDIITFNFQYKKTAVLLKAKVIRIDKIYDENQKNLFFYNYGCIFEEMPPNIEMIITRYLYIRQLEMHKDKWEKL